MNQEHRHRQSPKLPSLALAPGNDTTTNSDPRIEWSKSNIDILRLINATSEPYQGSFCNFEGEKLIIWRAVIGQIEEKFLAIPGQVTQIGKEGITIGCGVGKLIITEIEYKGERMNPNKLIKSIRKRLK